MMATILTMPVAKDSPMAQVAALTLDCAMGEAEAKRYLSQARIVAALEHTKGNVCRAAKLLGQHRNTVNLRLQQLGMQRLPGEIRGLYRQQLRFTWTPKAGPRGAVASCQLPVAGKNDGRKQA
jgi:hypothetical protein